MIETKRILKNVRGAINVNPALLIFVIGIVAVIGGMWYFKLGPFEQGDVRIDIGYIFENGDYAPVQPAAMVLYFDPIQPLAWYSDAGRTHRIAGVYGQLSVRVVGVGTDATTATISWNGHSTTGATSDVGNKIINIGSTVSIPESRMEARGFWYDVSQPTNIVDMSYDVTATAGSLSASTTAAAQVTIYWGATTLTITATVDAGTFNFVG